MSTVTDGCADSTPHTSLFLCTAHVFLYCVAPHIGSSVCGCESTNERTGRPVSSCVPVSVERVDEDKDADENVDVDQTSTGRPVGGQPTGLFTQLEEIDIDFRVCGLPHAVVKKAENFRVRELVKKTESHPHREALHADLQQNNVHNPFL